MSPRHVEGAAEANVGVRLQKVLASAGFGSRRACELIIGAGRVTINGRVAALGARVDPDRDRVQVDGVGVPTAADLVYLAVNKPAGMVSAMKADDGRPCIGDLVASMAAGLHHVGRLDNDSEGLLLVTNDGDLAHRLTHPSYGVSKRYLVEVDGVVPRSLGRTLRAGVPLDDGPASVDDYTVVDSTPGRSLLEVEIHEGRNRIVRRMFAACGHPVRRLVRLSVGPIRLGELKPGRVRHLNSGEVRSLNAAVNR
ncbi:MAG: rRNA synthase [Frankiaceae bacterium]|jgi:23S rRNA pseudouridine2605 synthase|nr:rRNA synthase [Frankiaceae bacterium]